MPTEINTFYVMVFFTLFTLNSNQKKKTKKKRRIENTSFLSARQTASLVWRKNALDYMWRELPKFWPLWFAPVNNKEKSSRRMQGGRETFRRIGEKTLLHLGSSNVIRFIYTTGRADGTAPRRRLNSTHTFFYYLPWFEPYCRLMTSLPARSCSSVKSRRFSSETRGPNCGKCGCVFWS